MLGKDQFPRNKYIRFYNNKKNNTNYISCFVETTKKILKEVDYSNCFSTFLTVDPKVDVKDGDT